MPMDADEPRRRWWRKKRWWAAVALWLPAWYPLSYGPALYGWYGGWLPKSVLTIYRPLGVLRRDGSAVERAWGEYVAWWTYRGLEAGGRNGRLPVEVWSSP